MDWQRVARYFTVKSTDCFAVYPEVNTAQKKTDQTRLDEMKTFVNQLLQLCTARTVFSILVTVRLYMYTVMAKVYRWRPMKGREKLIVV